MKNIINIGKIKQMKNKTISASIGIMTILSQKVYATQSSEMSMDELFTKTTQLVTDLTTNLIALSVVVGAGFLVYSLVRRSMSSEHEVEKWNTKIKITIGSTIGAVIGGSLLRYLVSYFAG